jgi:hypothetical protein
MIRFSLCFIAILSLFAQIPAYGVTEWTAPLEIPAPVPAIAGAQTANCYDSVHNRYFFAYVGNDFNIYYSIYSNGSWSSSAIIPNASSAGALSLCFDSMNDRVFMVWTDAETTFASYSIYSGDSWSAGSAIYNGANAQNDATVVYDSTNDRLFAFFIISGHPNYSIYSGGMWNAASAFSSDSFFSYPITACYDSVNDEVLAVWRVSPTIRYAVFSGGMWGPTSNLNASAVTENYVSLSFDPDAVRILASWVSNDNENVNYAFYSAGTWSAPQFSGGVGFFSTYNCYNTLNQQFFLNWLSNSDFSLMQFSIYSGTSWSSPLELFNSAGSYAAYLSYNPADDQVLATWINPANLPFSSFFQEGAPIAPPKNLSGGQQKNFFAVTSELCNTLNWKAGGSPRIIGYQIYRNGIFVESVGNSTFMFSDHNQARNQRSVYSVYSVHSSNEISAAATVVIP